MDEETKRSRKYRMRWWTLAVLSLSLIIIGLDNTILNVAIPTIQSDLDATASELQWMVDSYVVVFAGLLLTMGALGDRFGRKLTLQAGLVIFGLSSVLAAYSATSGQLIAARAVMGVGGALIMPSTLSIITDVFPREERGKAIGIWAGTAAFGIGIGPAIGGWLVEQFWWGSIFLINMPVTIIALAAGLVLVPKSRDSIPPRIDVPGSFLSITALTAFVFAIIEAPARDWLDPVVLGAFGLSFILGTAFFLQEKRSSHPMLDMSLFRNPRFSAGAGAITAAFFAMFGVIFILTQYLQFVHGYSALQAGVRIAPFAVGMMAGAANSHRLVRKFGTGKVVAGGMALLALTLASFALWGVATPYWIILVSLVLMSFGMANTMAPATDAVMGAVPLAKAGVGSAMNDTTRMVGGALGVAVIGSIVNSVYSSKMAAATAALPSGMAASARDSVGAAIAIGSKTGGPQGEALAATARAEFVSAMGIAFIAAAAVALVGSLMVLKFMPARHLGSQEAAAPGRSLPE